MSNITSFSQIIGKLDRIKFNKLLKVKQTDKHCKGYTSWTHLVSMLFCQFAKSQSVRDISTSLRSSTGNLNHLGIDRSPSKSTIIYQNKHRDHESFIGMSEDEVMIQIWTALITILILKVLKAQSKFEWYLSNLVAFIRLNLIVKIDLQLCLDKPFQEHIEPPPEIIQGGIFENIEN